VSFETFNLDPRILAGVKSAGFQTPTPIQSQTIPAALGGRDVLGLAQTGTGKTAAFVLPILQRLTEGQHRKIRALVISPTRELAEQTHQDFCSLGPKTRLKSMTIYGGVGMEPQIKKLRSGVDIVVACPGRLLDHMGQGNVDLSAVEVLVLDEGDRMLDMGFLPDVKRILKRVPRKRQAMLFSATMPDDIRRLANDILRDPAVAQIDHSRPAKTVSHALFPVEPHLKTRLLKSLLRSTETRSVLVFARTKIRTKRLADQLERAGFNVAKLLGDMPQNKRQNALNGFRDGKYQILVATDIASRGVDVLGISHVINYDMPDTPEAYTHRIGRTGRAEQTGTAYTFVTQDDAPAVRAFERTLAVEMECRELEGFDYDAPPPARGAVPGHRRVNNRPRRTRASAGDKRTQKGNPSAPRRHQRQKNAA
jgi:ATP-dependent RNA helicase RhlE